MWRRLPARLLLALLLCQVAASGLTAVRGFPYFGTTLVRNAPLWELPIALWHLPAIQLLSVSGYCCGFKNQLVFESRVLGGHVRMRPLGALILAASSWIWWSAVALIGLALWQRRRPVEEIAAAQDDGTVESEGAGETSG